MTGIGEDEIKLEHAEAIARTWRAHLIGLYTNLLPDLTMALPMDGGGAAVAGLIAELEEKAREEGGPVFDKLAARLDTLQVSHELRRLDERPGTLFQSVEGGPLRRSLPRNAALSRGGIVGLRGDRRSRSLRQRRGLLVIPPGRHWQASEFDPADRLERLSRGSEGGRRGNELRQKRGPHCHPHHRCRGGYEPAAEIARHLNRHGGRVEVTARNSEGRKVADVIIDEAYRVSAGLVVLGGYGHMRLRERVFGGATYDMLYTCETPILLAH